MWKVVYIANDIEEADKIKDCLTKEGFLVKAEAMDDGSCQIKVPETEAEDVCLFLNENETY